MFKVLDSTAENTPSFTVGDVFKAFGYDDAALAQASRHFDAILERLRAAVATFNATHGPGLIALGERFVDDMKSLSDAFGNPDLTGFTAAYIGEPRLPPTIVTTPVSPPEPEPAPRPHRPAGFLAVRRRAEQSDGG